MLSAFKLARTLLLGAATVLTVACDDGVGLDTWTVQVDTATLYSLSRLDLMGLPSGYDFVNHVVVEVESPSAIGIWDVALRDEGTQLALVPASGFEGQDSRAALALMSGVTFEGLREAPDDTARYSSNAAILQAGQIYVVRTRRSPCSFTGTLSVRFGKLRIIEVNQAAGTVRFETVVNPLCNDRRLIPPED